MTVGSATAKTRPLFNSPERENVLISDKVAASDQSSLSNLREWQERGLWIFEE